LGVLKTTAPDASTTGLPSSSSSGEGAFLGFRTAGARLALEAAAGAGAAAAAAVVAAVAGSYSYGNSASIASTVKPPATPVVGFLTGVRFARLAGFFEGGEGGSELMSDSSLSASEGEDGRADEDEEAEDANEGGPPAASSSVVVSDSPSVVLRAALRRPATAAARGRMGVLRCSSAAAFAAFALGVPRLRFPPVEGASSGTASSRLISSSAAVAAADEAMAFVAAELAWRVGRGGIGGVSAGRGRIGRIKLAKARASEAGEDRLWKIERGEAGRWSCCRRWWWAERVVVVVGVRASTSRRRGRRASIVPVALGGETVRGCDFRECR
jgi:hypothetical protein